MDTELAVSSMMTCSKSSDTGGRACRSTSAPPTCICASGILGSQRHHCSGDHLLVVINCFDETDSFFSHATEILRVRLACAGAFSLSGRVGKAGHAAFPQVMNLGDFWTFAEEAMREFLRREPTPIAIAVGRAAEFSAVVPAGAVSLLRGSSGEITPSCMPLGFLRCPFSFEMPLNHVQPLVRRRPTC